MKKFIKGIIFFFSPKRFWSVYIYWVIYFYNIFPYHCIMSFVKDEFKCMDRSQLVTTTICYTIAFGVFVMMIKSIRKKDRPTAIACAVHLVFFAFFSYFIYEFLLALAWARR